jgi:hypothetical protein
MFRSAVSKVTWLARATTTMVGLALILALIFGVASAALGADGDFFKVGKGNFASAVSTLTKSGVGPALRLKVGSGAPLAVNSSTKVTNLNADKLDGMDSAELLGGGHQITGQATLTSDGSAPVATVPGFGSISAVRQVGAAGSNDCRVVFSNQSGGKLSRLGIRQGANSSGVYSGIHSGVMDEDPSFGNGVVFELAGADAQPRGGFGTWQIVNLDMSKVLTVTATANFGVPGAASECDVAVQGVHHEQ